MKKLFTLLTLALFGIAGANAETYTDEEVRVKWINPSTSPIGVASPNAAVSSSLFTGNSSGTGTYDDIVYTLASSTQTFSFTFTPFPGLTFTPGSVEFDMVKFGSDNCFATVEIIYGGESEAETLADLNNKADICRNKANVNADKRHRTYTLDANKASTEEVTLKFTLKPASGKTMGVANVVITGKVSGTTQNVTKYNVAVASNNDSYGTVASTVNEVVEGNEVTLTATPNRGYKFVNWTDNNAGNAEISTLNTYTFTPVANINYTGNFTALTQYTVSIAANNDAFGTVSVNTFDDGLYYAGDEIIPEARPYLGYVFTNWSDGSTDWKHAAITLDEAVDLTANFAALDAPLANAVWDLSENTDVTSFTNMSPVLTEDSKVEFVGTQKVNNITFSKFQPTETADGSDEFSAVLTLNPTLTEGQAFVARSIELDAVRFGTSGGNFTIQVIRDGNVSKIATDVKPAESGTHYYFNLDDKKEALNSVVVKITLGGNLANNKQYGFANVKVNGYLRKATPKNVTITSAGYATYCSPSALNFAGIDGLKAYRAYVDEGLVKFVPVTKVPAGEGVLLKGNGNYNIPVIASAEPIENILVGVTEETPDVAAGIFVLMNGAQGVGFYKTTTPFTVGANTAYLPDNIDGARTFIGFDEEGEATGIEAIERNQQKESVFNLNGQRVAQPSKGLYIVNGKKVVLK